MMSGVNYIIYGCFSARTTPRVPLYRSLTLEENIVATVAIVVVVITKDRIIDDNFKMQIRNRTLCTCRLFLLN